MIPVVEIVLCVVAFFITHLLMRRRRAHKADRSPDQTTASYNESDKFDTHTAEPDESIVHILFGSQTGTAASYAHAIQEELNGKGIKSKLEDLKNFDPEDNFLYWNESKMNGPVLFLISTYTDGTPPPSCEWFCRWLQDASNDFRVNKSLLSNMR
uniref:Flavodoxin-like domain-containing protein n=1 Tax=Ciona savignyi TaxID=51511 RepID=H2YWM6_CIOSA